MFNLRHGDLAFRQIENLPEGLKETKSKVIMQGSHNNEHSFDYGKLYLKKVNDFVFGYFEAFSNTRLYHREHGKCCKGKTKKECHLLKGFYELRRQNEETNVGLRPVQD
jgi:hypothetical protein